MDVPASVDVTYNTGQGRAPGSLTAVLNRLIFEDSLFPAGDDRNTIIALLTPSRSLQLDGYTSQTASVNVPMNNLGFSGPVNGRLFEEFSLDIDHLLVENGAGGLSSVFGPGGNPVVIETFPSNVKALAGRHTSLQVFIDDAMITYDGSDVTFDRDLFEQVNLTDDGTGTFKLLGWISDYLVFDISAVANKPTMSNSVPATRVWFSGDSIALSGDVGAGPEAMEVLTALSPPIEGLFTPPVALPGGTGPGTYNLRQVDPRDLSNLARITALQGIWRNYVEPQTSKSPLLNLGNFECIMFPQSLDADKYDMVVISRNGSGTITNMYFGEANFDTATFSIWPIAQVDDGDASNEVSGSLSGLLDRNGSAAATPNHVRSGSFSITNGGVPAGFNTTGRFIVFRL